MLHHEPTPTEQSATSAQRRVTPEELAQALAALDARGEEQAKTIAIGEAVDQLNLRATPDELWAEVQAQRQARNTTGAKRLPGSARRAAWVGACALLAALLGWGVYTDRSAPPPDTQSAADAPAALAPSAPTGQNVSVTQDTPSGPLVELLSEAREGVPVRCKYDVVSRIAPGHLARSGGYMRLTTSGDARPDVSWTLIKHGGAVYLRGWTQSRISPGAIGTLSFTVYNSSRNASHAMTPITLRLGKFDCDVTQAVYGFGDEGDWEAITVHDVRPDRHLWDEK